MTNISTNGNSITLTPNTTWTLAGSSVVAGAAVPVEPPPEWFTPLTADAGAYDVVIEDDGRVHGYPAATWDTCHLSFDECLTPPRSATDYAYFKVGAIRAAGGERVKTGPLTLKGGHADRTLSAAKAMAYYDDTDSAFADVAIGENELGIWVAGALRPTASPEAIRAAMASGFSGDWRWIGDSYELIALSAVNTPGFRRKVDSYERDGIAASMIVDMPRGDSDEAVIVTTTTEVEVTGVVDSDAVVASMAHRIAASIGRTPEQRVAALRLRVHPEPLEVS
jgi:hypothetical protein